MAAKSMPTSLQDFAAAQVNPKAQCRVCLLSHDIRQMLTDPAIPATVKAKWLETTHGFKITGDALRRHLNSHPVG